MSVYAVEIDKDDHAREFYYGKRIAYIVTANPGGGYDTYARLIARYMQKYLPGTRISILNIPGAGGIVGTNLIYKSRPDGLTIGAISSGMIYAQLMQREGIRFDLRNFDWIGKAANTPRVIVTGINSGIDSITDLQNSKTPVLFGTPGIGSASHNEILFIKRSLGLNIKLVPFMSGNSDLMSIMRNEISASFASFSSIRSFVENGQGRIVLHIGGDELFDKKIPSASSLINEPAGKNLLGLIETISGLGRLTVAPPGTVPERLDLLRQAYQKALTDNELLEEANRMQLPVNTLFGHELNDSINAVLNQPEGMMKLIRSFNN